MREKWAIIKGEAAIDLRIITAGLICFIRAWTGMNPGVNRESVVPLAVSTKETGHANEC